MSTDAGNTSNYGRRNNFGRNNNFVTGDGNTANSGTQNFYGDVPGPRPDRERREEAREPERAGVPTAPDPDRSRNVFVVHGRDEEARMKMFDLLRLLDLHPLDWEDLIRATGRTAPYLGEVVANAPAQAQAALVLLTPDDVVQLHPELHGPHEPPYETRPTAQPRPNVLIELGMVLAAYPERTLLVQLGEMRPIADIGGMNYIRFDGSETALGKIVERLKLAGCKVNDTGSDWRHTWPYRLLSAYGRTGQSVSPAS
ncbi:TIR domain-containing protein [Streptomyces sp. TRM68416]|uniref:TIR domain-containing protein n=1 Tax=Streptomyces sp. TRM68416 TaxID=2758412 RepID=UPI001661CB30|nr:TIR domain-containing protein [Streptomyces sp. TRM68416]MBD0837709.1 nucleotide-binding protein [Streptomyces sp. TRM68416]